MHWDISILLHLQGSILLCTNLIFHIPILIMLALRGSFLHSYPLYHMRKSNPSRSQKIFSALLCSFMISVDFASKPNYITSFFLSNCSLLVFALLKMIQHKMFPWHVICSRKFDFCVSTTIVKTTYAWTKVEICMKFKAYLSFTCWTRQTN